MAAEGAMGPREPEKPIEASKWDKTEEEKLPECEVALKQLFKKVGLMGVCFLKMVWCNWGKNMAEWISVTLGISRIPKIRLSNSPVFMVFQNPWTRSMTHCNKYLHVKLCGVPHSNLQFHFNYNAIEKWERWQHKVGWSLKDHQWCMPCSTLPARPRLLGQLLGAAATTAAGPACSTRGRRT